MSDAYKPATDKTIAEVQSANDRLWYPPVISEMVEHAHDAKLTQDGEIERWQQELAKAENPKPETYYARLQPGEGRKKIEERVFAYIGSFALSRNFGESGEDFEARNPEYVKLREWARKEFGR